MDFQSGKSFGEAETQSFSTIPSNTVYIKACWKMSKIDQIHIRAVMLCMLSKMGKEHTHTFLAHNFLNT